MKDHSPFTSPNLHEPQTRRRGVRWWLILSIFGIPIILLMLATFIFRVGYTLRENSGRRAMVEELQNLDQEGYAIDNESIDWLYETRTSAENVEAWLELFAAIETPEFKQAYTGVPPLDRSIDDEAPLRSSTEEDWPHLDECSRFVSEAQGLIESVHALASAEVPTRFPINFRSTETLLPEVQSIRQVALIVFVDSQVATSLRESQRATRDIRTLYSLANQADAVPGTIPGLVGLSIRRLALQAVQACIEIDLLTPNQLLLIDQTVEEFCNIGDRWHTVISDELGLVLPVFTNPSIAMKTETVLPARGHDAVYFIGLMRRAMELDTQDWAAFHLAATQLDEEVSASVDSWIQSTDRLLSHLFAPAFASQAALWISDAQLHRQARVAIAIRAHEDSFSELPNSLDDLPRPLAELRPMGDKPFGYELTDHQAVLWGFEPTTGVHQTPDSPPTFDSGVPGSSDNFRLVWQINRNTE